MQQIKGKVSSQLKKHLMDLASTIVRNSSIPPTLSSFSPNSEFMLRILNFGEHGIGNAFWNYGAHSP